MKTLLFDSNFATLAGVTNFEAKAQESFDLKSFPRRIFFCKMVMCHLLIHIFTMNSLLPHCEYIK